MIRQKKLIAAFGSSRISADDMRFKDVESLAEKLGEKGWSGLVGGYQGMMAAFSHGIRAGGKDVIGITLEVFPTPPNDVLSEEKRADNFFDRMQALIEQPSAYLVLPGGLGTLAEFSMTWDLLAIGVLEPRPLIVYGECWKPLITMITQQLVMSVDDNLAAVQYCETHEQVLEILET